MAKRIEDMSDDEIAAIDIDNINPDDFEISPDDGDTDDLPDEDEKSDTEENSQEEKGEEESSESDSSEESGEELDTTTDDGDDDENTDEEDADESGEESETDEESDEKDGEESDAADKAPDDKSKDKLDESGKTVSDADKIAAYDRLMGTFKANGIDMKAESVEDALNLQRMGANYHKKMATIKPHLKTATLLNRHGIDEAALSFLIDIHNGNEGAITKLIKDKKLNPLSIDVEADTSYESKTHAISDEEYDLDSAISEVQQTPTGARAVEVVANEWDGASREFVRKSPKILHAINEHIASGHYEQIVNKVASEKAFGRLVGLSDLEAYHQVGNSLFPTTSDRTDEEANTVVKAKVPKTKNSKVKSKKRSAGSTTAVVNGDKAPKLTSDIIADMSDEDVLEAMENGTFGV